MHSILIWLTCSVSLLITEVIHWFISKCLDSPRLISTITSCCIWIGLEACTKPWHKPSMCSSFQSKLHFLLSYWVFSAEWFCKCNINMFICLLRFLCFTQSMVCRNWVAVGVWYNIFLNKTLNCMNIFFYKYLVNIAYYCYLTSQLI